MAGIEYGEPVPVAAEQGPEPNGLTLTVWPNPTRASAEVRFTLRAPSAMRLVVYDLLGREVARLAEGTHGAGEHRVRFETAALPAGVYIVQVSTEDAIENHPVTLLR